MPGQRSTEPVDTHRWDPSRDPGHGRRGTPNPAVDLTDGVVLGERYRLIRRLGAGGMGDVWEAQHVVIGKPCAIKILSNTEAAADQRLPERFMREARAIAAIRHENIVDITDFGHAPNGAPYFVMELLIGRTLKQLLAESGPVPWERARPLLLQLADGLQAVHAHGMIHRDLKPDNVFVLPRDKGRELCKIIDFGIAKLMQLDSQAQQFTRTGMVFGTPAFMSPEQARGEKVDVRTDVYSFGCLAYNIVTGEKPFPGDSPTEVLFKQLFAEPLPPRQINAAIPAGVEAIILKCLRKEPTLRFSEMQQVRDAIDGVGSTAPLVVVPPERLPTPPVVPPFARPPTPRPPPGASAVSMHGTGGVPNPADLSRWNPTSSAAVRQQGFVPDSATKPTSSSVLAWILAAMFGGVALGGGGYLAYTRFAGTTAAADSSPAPQPTVETTVAPAPVAAPVEPAISPPETNDSAPSPNAIAEPIQPAGSSRTADPSTEDRATERLQSRAERSSSRPAYESPSQANPAPEAPKPEAAPIQHEPVQHEPPPLQKPKPRPKPDGDLVNPFGQ